MKLGDCRQSFHFYFSFSTCSSRTRSTGGVIDGSRPQKLLDGWFMEVVAIGCSSIGVFDRNGKSCRSLWFNSTVSCIGRLGGFSLFSPTRFIRASSGQMCDSAQWHNVQFHFRNLLSLVVCDRRSSFTSCVVTCAYLYMWVGEPSSLIIPVYVDTFRRTLQSASP